MAAYVSHMIMADELYEKIDYRRVSRNYLRTFSLGGDLSKYSKCRRLSHRTKLKEFIYNMCDYIKEKKLIHDKEIIGVLYGHICHVEMDKYMHPLVWELEKRSMDVGFKKHTLIEGYIDYYLVKYKYDIDISKYNNKDMFRGRMKLKIFKMINHVYFQTYGIKRVGFSYIFCRFLLSNVDLLYVFLGRKLLVKFSKFDKYKRVNKLDLVNDRKRIYYKNFDGVKCNDSLMELYYKSIEESIKKIDEVNKYLYE